MSGRRRVLVVSPALPVPSWGFGTRVHHLTRSLAEQHDVTLLAYARDDERPARDALATFCRQVVTVPYPSGEAAAKRRRQTRSLLSPAPFHASGLWSPQFQRALDRCLGERPDVVQVESSQLMLHALPASAAVVLDEHNVESELLQRMQVAERSWPRRAYNRLEAAKYRRLEDRVWPRVAGCATTSERERRVLEARAPGTVARVVPNGVDPGAFRPSAVPADPDTLVFTGILGYRPNLDAVLFLVDEVLPLVRARRPRVRLEVIGTGTPDEIAQVARPGVEVTGFVPEVLPHLTGASVVVVPIRMGSGTRLKVVEAAAAGRPIVSTTVGCEGIDVRDGRHLLVADDAPSFADAVCRLLEDRALGARLGAAARDLAVASYSWQRSGQLLEELHVAALDARQARVAA